MRHRVRTVLSASLRLPQDQLTRSYTPDDRHARHDNRHDDRALDISSDVSLYRLVLTVRSPTDPPEYTARDTERPHRLTPPTHAAYYAATNTLTLCPRVLPPRVDQSDPGSSGRRRTVARPETFATFDEVYASDTTLLELAKLVQMDWGKTY
ncbi:hypothetical protein K438DRAFT_1970344 [Mycena galopus ATCC 62051]|nr:hypothetical protein K438DRAFT_1970344 [Mycena galopus ATCC 62051]